MISVAILLSTVSGFAIPLESFLTGRLFNVFISFNAATQLSDVLTNTTTSEMCTLNIVQQLLSNVSNVTDNVFCDVSQQGNVINSASAFVCDPTETLTDEATAHALYLVYLAVGVFVTYFLSQILWAASASRQSSRIRIEFYRATLRHNIGWFETNDTSTIGPLFLRGIENIRAGIGTQAGNFLKDVTIFFVGIVWAFAINWKLALVLLTLFPVVSFLGGLSIMATKKSKEIEESAYLKADSAATEVLSAIRTVLAFGGEEREERRYGKHAKEAEMQAIKGGFVTTIIFGVLFFFGLSMFGVAFWYGGVLLADCEIEGGDVLTVLTLVLYGAFSVGGALPQLGTFISASSSASAVFNIIDDIPKSLRVWKRPGVCRGRVEFSGVRFSYPARPDVEILQGLDFVIEPGQTVAIVGPSGNGKSTLLQLLQHLYTPSCGQVTIDGVAVQELDPDWLHQNVGVVTQEPVMFNANIRENILLANSRATQEEVETATTTANAHSFITDLPDGYDTYVGEGGIQLSGGQKQRIAIARALLRNPQILLLDEATSALDNQSERLVQNALEKASKNRTTIVIAHRLSTIQNADVIVCVKGGQIEESGTHEELVSKQGLYSELVGTQLEGIKSAEGSSKGNNHHFNRQALTVRHSKHKQRHLANFKKYRSCNTSGWLNYSGHNKKDKDTSESAIASEDVSDRNKNKLFYLWTFIKPDWAIALIAVVLYSLIGITYPLIGALLANINTVFSESDRSTIIELSRNISLGFIGLAFAAGCFFFLGSFAVTASGERLTTRLRVSAFKAMLHQTLGWHDEEENTTGSLSTLLSVDANSVKDDVTFGHISGNSVYFHYPRRPEVKVLKELSVSVSPGETLALVGSSGSGKSTIISLIERFYQPTVGTITLDRQDLSTLDLKWLRSQIGYVPQEPVLFNTTIADNIRYGALFREVSDEEIAEVAKACNIHDFIQSLPQGYSTQVGVGGTFLSGGQKQRIAIARALVRNPKILLLDEATSSLDAESEQAVQETLKKARVGRTSIVVAHRLSTVRDANCIAVMQNGKVVESGTHTSLITKRGAYYDLVTAQVNS